MNLSRWGLILKKFTYKFCTDNMPILGISFEMRVLHQGVILEHSLPVFIIFSIASAFTGELFYWNLMAIVVLEDEVTEICCLSIFFELNVNICLRWSLRFSSDFARNWTVSQNYVEFVFFLEVSKHARGCIIWSVHI